MTRLHVVALRDPEYAHDVYGQLSEAYDSNNVLWVVEGSMLLVRYTGVSCVDVAAAAGLDEEKPGVVFRLGSGYSGYMPQDFWTWLDE